jgi:hypothetical protein
MSAANLSDFALTASDFLKELYAAIKAESTSKRARLTGPMALLVIGLNVRILLIAEGAPFDKYVALFVMELVS